jgi:hypothetical protein
MSAREPDAYMSFVQFCRLGLRVVPVWRGADYVIDVVELWLVTTGAGIDGLVELVGL